jgi:hypothetical protein
VRQTFVDLACETIAERNFLLVKPHAEPHAEESFRKWLSDGGLILVRMADEDVPRWLGHFSLDFEPNWVPLTGSV